MWQRLFVIINLILLNSIIAQDVGQECRPNRITLDGICTVFSECQPAIKAIQENGYHSFDRCGFKGKQEVVCCPRTTQKFGVETPTITKRIAETECENIINESTPKVGAYIINGVEAELGEFPFMVALGFDRGAGYEFDCGGSLVSKNYVLSAAHCVDTLDEIQPSIVRAGVIYIGGKSWNDETDYRVEEIIKHPQYTRREKYHDLTLMRLDRDITITSNLFPACIETGELALNAPLTITGWGRTSNTRSTKSNILLKANLVPVSSTRCNESYKNMHKLPRGISNEQICAGDPKGLKDTCQGDSGGPLSLAGNDNLYRLVGVTSFGRGCGSPIPGVYTRVTNYLDWIESTVWRN